MAATAEEEAPMYLKNFWYVVAWAHELEGESLVLNHA